MLLNPDYRPDSDERDAFPNAAFTILSVAAVIGMVVFYWYTGGIRSIYDLPAIVFRGTLLGVLTGAVPGIFTWLILRRLGSSESVALCGAIGATLFFCWWAAVPVWNAVSTVF